MKTAKTITAIMKKNFKNFMRVLALPVLLCLGGSAGAQTSNTYTMQAGNFETNALVNNNGSTCFAGTYDGGGAVILGQYSNGSGCGTTSGVASYRRFSTTSTTITSLAARQLYVGDQFNITVAPQNQRALSGKIGMALINTSTFGSDLSVAQDNTKALMRIEANSSVSSGVFVVYSGSSLATSSTTSISGTTSSSAITITITSQTTFNVTIGASTFTNLTFNSTATWPAVAFVLYDIGNNPDVKWSSSTLTGTTTSTFNGTTNLSAGLITNGTNSNSTSTTFTNGLQKSNTNTLTLTGANSYTGTTVVSGGSLALGIANALPVGSSAGNITLNSTVSPTLNTGSGVGFSIGTSTASANSAGALIVSAASSLSLGTGNSLYFKASNGQAWAGTLSITGWSGTEGSSGTGAKLFIGSDATGLTVTQLGKITFSGHVNGTTILSTGEVVPAAPSVAADVALSSTNPAVAAANLTQGTTGNSVYAFNLTVSTATAILTAVTFNSTNTSASDISNYKLLYNTTNTLSGATSLPPSLTTSLGTGSHTVTLTSPLSLPVSVTPYYFFITTDVAGVGTSTVNNTLSVSAITTGNLSFGGTAPNLSGTAFGGGTQTIVAPIPGVVLASSSPAVPAASLGQGTTNNSIYNFNLTISTTSTTLTSVTFNTTNTSASDVTNYKLLYNTTNTIGGATTLLPSISSSLGTGSHTFTLSSPPTLAVGTYYFFVTTDVAASGTSTPGNTLSVSAITTSNLSFSGTAPSVSGTASAGGTQTIIQLSNATDYFRSSATGTWSNATSSAVWESSPDGVTWHAATLTPGSSATSVEIVSPHVVTISSSITLGGTLTIDNGATLATSVTITTNGAVTVNGTFKITGTQSQSTVVTTSTGAWTYSQTTGTLYFNTNATYNIDNITQLALFWPTAAGSRPYNVTLEAVANGNAIQLNNAASRTIDGTFKIFGTASNNAFLYTNGGGSYIVNGTMEIGVGGVFTNNVVSYGSSSTLKYNTGTTISSLNQTWITGSGGPGLGLPANVQLSGNTTVTMPNTASYNIKGNLTVDVGSTFTFPSGNSITVSSNVINNGTVTLGSATGGDLTLSGNLTNNGTWTNNSRAVSFAGTGTSVVTASSGTQFFDYLLINKTSGSVQISSSTNVTINTTSGDLLQFLNAGTLDLNGRTLTLNNAGGNILVNGTTGGTAKSITSTSAATIAITNTKTASAIASGTLNIGSNVVVVLTGSFDPGGVTTFNGTLRISSGGSIASHAPFYGSGSLLQYYSGTNPYARNTEWNATGVGTVGATAGYPYNVQVSNGTTINFPNGSNTARACGGNLTIDAGSSLYADYGAGGSVDLTVGGNLSLAGNLSLGGVFGSDLHLKGDWTHTTGTFSSNTRAVEFSGASGNQTITNAGGETFDYLTINKASGSVILANNVVVSSLLILTNGFISNGLNNLTIASISGGSSSAYIVTTGSGVLKATFSGTKLFPIGTSNTSYTPVTITNSTSMQWAVRVESNFNNYPAINSSSALPAVWVITPATTPTSTATTVLFQYPDAVWTTPATLNVYHFDANGTGWAYGWNVTGSNGTSLTASLSNGMRTIQLDNQYNFSPFALTGTSSPLPITLLSFSGKKESNKNLLSWTTATEIDNKGFEIQRSTDGRSFSSVGFVNSKATNGNSQTDISYLFSDMTSMDKAYYRLRQVDISGRSSFSQVVLIRNNVSTNPIISGIYPNPAKEKVNANIEVTQTGTLSIIISDVFGRIIKNQLIAVETGTNNLSLDVSDLMPGTYLIKTIAPTGEECPSVKFIKQ